MVLGLLGVALAAVHAAAAEPPGPAGDAARKLYLRKCARCHRLYEPAAYDDRTWQEWMVKMRRKARLNPEQYALLSSYLDGLRHAAGASRQGAP